MPFAEAYLEGVELPQRQVRMNLPEGMLEINAPMTAEEKQEQAGKRKETKVFPVYLCDLCVEDLVFEFRMKADIVTIFPDFFRGPWITGLPAGPRRWAW